MVKANGNESAMTKLHKWWCFENHERKTISRSNSTQGSHSITICSPSIHFFMLKCWDPSHRSILVAGWPPTRKNDGLNVSWDDDIPNIYIYIDIDIDRYIDITYIYILLEKYESQLGWFFLFPIYGKIKFMVQTTNQIYIQSHTLVSIWSQSAHIGDTT